MATAGRHRPAREQGIRYEPADRPGPGQGMLCRGPHHARPAGASGRDSRIRRDPPDAHARRTGNIARAHGADPAAALAELAARDVIAFGADGEIRADYPFSPVPTPIQVRWAG